MSEGTEGTAAAPEAPAPAAVSGAEAEAFKAVEATPPPAPEAPAPAAAPEADPFDDEKVETFDRKYVQKLREEAAAARVKAKEAAKPFEGWSESDAAVLADVIQEAANDPKVGAAKMREIAALLDGGDVEGAAAVAAKATGTDLPPALTAEDVDKKVHEALEATERQRQIDSRRDEILAWTKDHGYDAADPDYFTLLHIAQHETGGDLEKAHEKIEARNQAIVDKYVANVRAKAAGQPLHAPRGNEDVVEPSGDNKTWKSAKDRVEARLVALRQSS